MIGLILKNRQNNKCVSIHKIIQLIVMKTKLKMKTRSLKYEIMNLGLDMGTNIINITMS